MKPTLVSVHYHLRPGGVTTVIQQTERIFAGAGLRHRSLSCETPGLEALDYQDHPRESHTRLLLAALLGESPAAPRVWHFHNPCLGKNLNVTRVVLELARAGEALILQHHDFAEDQRPLQLEQLRQLESPYPLGPHIRHAFLNPRDRRIFLDAGLPTEQAVLLPNPRPPVAALPPPTAKDPQVLVPLRGLPRKNLGEVLLLAAAAPAGSRFFQGSAPRQPEWRASFEHWCDLAARENLPVEFDVFRHATPTAMMAGSTHLLTTSVQEGFGMIHLEAAGRRRVIGRLLSGIDLEGFPQDGLYKAILIDNRDFAILSPSEQEKVIVGVASGTLDPLVVDARGCHPIRHWLAEQLSERRPGPAEEALKRHSDEAHLHRLTTLCRTLTTAPGTAFQTLDAARIARSFELIR